MEEMAAVERRDVDVVIAIVIVIADCAAHAVKLDIQMGLVGYVSERPVVIVVIESRVGFVRCVLRPIFGVNEQDVLIAVIVVVDEAGSAAHCFGEIFLSEGAIVVLEMDFGLRRYVSKADWPRGADHAGSLRSGIFRHRGRRGLRRGSGLRLVRNRSGLLFAA